MNLKKNNSILNKEYIGELKDLIYIRRSLGVDVKFDGVPFVQLVSMFFKKNILFFSGLVVQQYS